MKPQEPSIFWIRFRRKFLNRECIAAAKRGGVALLGLIGLLLLSAAAFMVIGKEQPLAHQIFGTQAGVTPCGFDNPVLYPKVEAVSFNPSALQHADMTATLFGTEVRFERIARFDGRLYSSWIGRVKGWSDGYFNFVRHGKSFLGAFGAGGRSFALRGCNGAYSVAEVNPSALPELTALDASYYELIPAAGCGEARAADSVEIDVMVLFTKEVQMAAGKQADRKDSMGSREAVILEIVQALEVSNMAFANSLLPVRFRLCHAEAVPESKNEPRWESKGRLNETLNRLRNDNRVQELRDLHHADLVCLFVENGQDAGYGDYYNSYFTETSNAAFSVVRRMYATNHFSMAHEFGHNLGLDHDCSISKRGGAGHGYYYVNMEGRRVGTIMSVQKRSVRIPFFSDPEMGRGTRGSGAQDCYSNDIEVLRQSAHVISHYRCNASPEDSSLIDSLFNIQ